MKRTKTKVQPNVSPNIQKIGEGIEAGPTSLLPVPMKFQINLSTPVLPDNSNSPSKRKKSSEHSDPIIW